MKKQYLPLYIGLLASAAPLFSADQKPTQSIMQAEANIDITKYVFGCTPPFSTRHINEVAHEEHTVDVERFKPLQTNALESIATRLSVVQKLRIAYAGLDTESTQLIRAQLEQAKEVLHQAQQTISALAAKCGNNKATISTQDILRCAQWAKTLELEDNYIDLTFHNGTKFSTSCRILGPNGAVGRTLSHHEWVERSQYGPEAAQYATTGVDSGEVKDANLDFLSEDFPLDPTGLVLSNEWKPRITASSTQGNSVPEAEESVDKYMKPDVSDEWQWGKPWQASQELVAEYNKPSEPEPVITTLPKQNSDKNFKRPWGRGADTNPELVQAMLNQGTQKGFTSLPVEVATQPEIVRETLNRGAKQSWASIGMKAPAQEQATQEVRPFVWGESKLPKQEIIDQFDAKAKKGPQTGVISMPCEPSSSNQ